MPDGMNNMYNYALGGQPVSEAPGEMGGEPDMKDTGFGLSSVIDLLFLMSLLGSGQGGLVKGAKNIGKKVIGKAKSFMGGH